MIKDKDGKDICGNELHIKWASALMYCTLQPDHDGWHIHWGEEKDTEYAGVQDAFTVTWEKGRPTRET